MALFKSRLKRAVEDPGFGYGFFGEDDRLLKKNGQFNVYRSGLGFFERVHAYQFMIDLSWLRFFILVFSTFFLVNIFFALLYFWIGVEYIGAPEYLSEHEAFKNAFYFSTQTITTVGYGKLNPKGDLCSLISAFESITGFLFFAMVTGLLYGRFSRPRTRLRFSQNAVVCPYKNGKALMFRMANTKDNPFVEVEAHCFLSYIDSETEKRVFLELKLERNHISMMALNWTIVHELDKDSPFNGLLEDIITDNHFEVMLTLKGYDETYGQIIYSRTSYTQNEVLLNKKFKAMVEKKEGLHYPVLNLGEIDTTIDVD